MIKVGVDCLSNSDEFCCCWAFPVDKLCVHSFLWSWILWANQPQSPPSHHQDYSTCRIDKHQSYNSIIHFFSMLLVQNSNTCCVKIVSSVGGLNPIPLGDESSAFTTRTQLLALIIMTDFIVAPSKVKLACLNITLEHLFSWPFKPEIYCL